MIYDCFTFLNELDLLEIRLNELKDVVDRFVLVEATKTFTRNEKPLIYEANKDRFKEFSDKIIHIVVDTFPDGNSWDYEFAQRNAIERGWTEAKEGDFILISDIDEIPNASTLAAELNANPPLPFALYQECYYYFLNTYRGPWTGTVIYPYKKGVGPPEQMRQQRMHLPVSKNGGWHFSFTGGAQAVSYKIKSFAHTEFNDPFYTDVDQVSGRIAKLADPFLRGTGLEVRPITCTPKFVQENKERFAHLLWQK